MKFWDLALEDPADLKDELDRDTRAKLNDAIFETLSYDDKLHFSDRPEQIDGPSEEAWKEINDDLGYFCKQFAGTGAAVGRKTLWHELLAWEMPFVVAALFPLKRPVLGVKRMEVI